MVVWTDVDKEKIAALFITVLPGIKFQKDEAAAAGLLATADIPATFKISALKAAVRNAGSVLTSCDFDLSHKTVQFHLQPSATEAERGQQWFCAFETPPPLPEGLNEDQARIERVTSYAKTYRGPLTPAQVDVQVCDEKLQPLQQTTNVPDVYHVRIKGWREASLDQLEAFMHMFPYHVSDVIMLGGQQQQCEFVLVVRGKLSPLKPLFKRLLGL